MLDTNTKRCIDTVRCHLIETALDKPICLLSTLSFFIAPLTLQLPSRRHNRLSLSGTKRYHARVQPSAFKTCLWFLAQNKNADAERGFRDRRHIIASSDITS
jgi:hypothetical protein